MTATEPKLRVVALGRRLGLFALALSTVTCCRRPSGADGGPTTTYLPSAGLDGGSSSFDGGSRADAGALSLDGGVAVPVHVTGLAPSRGPLAGGTPVTLSGSGFLSGLLQDPAVAATVTQVSFGGNPAIGVSVLADGTIQVSTPPGQVGPATVTVTNSNGTGSCPGCFTYQATVQIDSVSPPRGPTTGATSVTITGSGFDAETILLFGPHAALHTQFISPTTLEALTPAAALAGPVDVRAFNGSGAALLHGAFSYFAYPRLVSIEPAGGPTAGGTALLIKGSGFLGEAIALSVGGQPATQTTIVDDRTITALAPPGTPGPADLEIQDPEGTATLPGGYIYYPSGLTQFALIGVSPPRGSSAGAARVEIVGSGFDTTAQVAFGGVPATGIQLLDPHRLAAITPAGPVGSVAVVATEGSRSATLQGGYTYFADITLSSVTPSIGPTSGGTTLTLTGSGFAAGDRVFIGALEATAVQISGSTSLTAVTPPGTAGPNDVRIISGADPTIFTLLSDAFSYQDGFRLIQVAPASGSQAGGTYVQLLGMGFGVGIGATFAGATARDLELVDPYTLACHTPPGMPGPADVTATLPVAGAGTGSSSTLPGGFSYFDPTNVAGGESGGPLDGTLNVTVLDDDPGAYGQPILGATVRLGLDPRTPFIGQTDSHGQITFSDPSLVKAQTVTASYGGAVAATVDAVANQNLTIFLDVPQGSGSMPMPCPCGAPPDCPTNCGLPFCGAFGSCVQCLQDTDCQNPGLPGYSSSKPHCNPPGGVGGVCVQCVLDSDCAGNAAGAACDNQRGAQSSFSCVQCTSDKFCSSGDYCNPSSLTCLAPDVISGAVYGFKLPTSAALSSTQHLEAHVGLLQPAVYAFEPFQPDPAEIVLTADGAPFSLTLDQGPVTVAVYAKFGIADTSMAPPTFTPILLGILQGVYVDPQHPVTGANVILDTHLDQTAPLQILQPLTSPASLTGSINPNPVHYDTFAYLDLGQAGIVPLNDVDSSKISTNLPGLPPVAGNGVLFLTQAYEPPPPHQAAFADPSQRAPASLFFRRVSGSFTSGVPLGPLLSFTNPTHPTFAGPLDGTFSWSFSDSNAPAPDLTKLDVLWTQVDASGNPIQPPQQIWEIVVPGSQTSVTIPADQLSQITQGLPPSTSVATTLVIWYLYTARSPRFDYGFWSYQELSLLTWTSYQMAYSLALP